MVDSLNSIYFATRARQSRSAAALATDIGPAGIHAALATAYERLVGTAGKTPAAEPTPLRRK